MSSPVPGSKSIFWLAFLLIVLRLSGVASDNELHEERTHDGAVSPNQAIEDRLLLGVSSILGSKKEAEQFDDLSPEEAKKRLRGIAKRMDANQDGYVDKEEMKKWILKSFTSLALEEAIERFEDADQNGDKLVSWDEHVLESFGDLRFDKEEDKAETQEAMDEEREIFDLADKDKNGLLTVEEYRRVAQPQDYPEMHKLIVTHALRRKDSDGDGKISMEEFLKDEKLSKEHLLEERERFQFELDENKDSVLDFNEFHRWVIPDNDLIADQEVEHLLMRADDNGDGKLSIDEIVDHHETFVSSEVTDFGEHLVKFKDEL